MTRVNAEMLRRVAYRILPDHLIAALRNRSSGKRRTVSSAENERHPERLAVVPHLLGRTLEVGCGHRKTLPDVVGVDLFAGRQLGRVGNVTGHMSVADVAARGEALPFRNGCFDTVVARHNLEHYVDTLATLREWARVTRVGGTLAVVVPDEERYPGRTVELDPTHYHSFTESSLRALVDATGCWTTTHTAPVVENWSFLLVARREVCDPNNR